MTTGLREYLIGRLPLLSLAFDESAKQRKDKYDLDVCCNYGDEAPAKGKAASVAFFTPQNKVLFVKRSASEENWADTWSWPGGKVDEGEGEYDAVRRECEEELGHCPEDDGQWIKVETKRTPFGWDHTTFACPVEDEFEPTLNSEHSAYLWRGLNELPEPLHPGVKASLEKLKDIAEDEEPVPLDPDILELARNMPSNIIQQLYQLQAERDRYREPGEDAEFKNPAQDAALRQFLFCRLPNLLAYDAPEGTWSEEVHPRDKTGKFAKKGSASPKLIKQLKDAGYIEHPDFSKTEIYHHPETGHHVGFIGMSGNSNAIKHLPPTGKPSKLIIGQKGIAEFLQRVHGHGGGPVDTGTESKQTEKAIKKKTLTPRERIKQIIDPMGYYHTVEAQTIEAFKNANIAIDISGGSWGRPSEFRLREWKGTKVIQPEELDPELQHTFDHLKESSEMATKASISLSHRLTDEEAKEVKSLVAEELDYPDKKIKISKATPTDRLNGRRFRVAGHAFLNTGIIKIYQKNVSSRSICAVTAHEVMHQKWEAVKRQYEKEQAEFHKKRAEIYPNDLSIEEVNRDYPTYAAIGLMPASALQKHDGLTDYSRDWWKSYEDGHTSSTRLPIHETLAEMAALDWEGMLNEKDLSIWYRDPNPWKKVYKAILERFPHVPKIQRY